MHSQCTAPASCAKLPANISTLHTSTDCTCVNKQVQGVVPGIGLAVGGSCVKLSFTSAVEVPLGTGAGLHGNAVVSQLLEVVMLRALVELSPVVTSVGLLPPQLELTLPAVEL